MGGHVSCLACQRRAKEKPPNSLENSSSSLVWWPPFSYPSKQWTFLVVASYKTPVSARLKYAYCEICLRRDSFWFFSFLDFATLVVNYYCCCWLFVGRWYFSWSENCTLHPFRPFFSRTLSAFSLERVEHMLFWNRSKETTVPTVLALAFTFSADYTLHTHTFNRPTLSLFLSFTADIGHIRDTTLVGMLAKNKIKRGEKTSVAIRSTSLTNHLLC